MSAEPLPCRVHHVHVCRRPVHDAGTGVVAYLLSLPSHAPGEAGDLLLRILVDVGVERLTAGHDAVVCLDGQGLATLATALPHTAGTILEVDLEAWRAHPMEVRYLRSLGYRWCVRVTTELPQPLPEMIRVPMEHATEAFLEEVEDLDLFTIVSDVDDRESYKLVRNLGWTAFDGAYWQHPEEVEGIAITPQRDALFRILEVVYDERSSMRDVEQAVRTDPGLVHRILKILGSASVGPGRPIHSLRQGLVFLGMRAIGNWTTLMLLESLTGKSDGLVTAAILRARTCELLAHRRCDPASAFTVGLLSYFDALLDMPLPAAVARLPLSEALSEAVLERTGPLGQVLDEAIALELGEVPLGIAKRDAARIVNLAMIWTDELRKA